MIDHVVCAKICQTAEEVTSRKLCLILKCNQQADKYFEICYFLQLWLHLFFFCKLQDYSVNMETIRDLTKEFSPQIILVESGGDNLAANFSRELADYIIYVIDVAGLYLNSSLCPCVLPPPVGWGL